MDGLDGRLSLHQLLPCQAQLRLPQGVGGWEGEGAQRVGQGRGTDGVWGRGGGARVGVHAGAGRVNGHGQCTWQRRELERRPGGHREGCPAHSLPAGWPAQGLPSPPARPSHSPGWRLPQSCTHPPPAHSCPSCLACASPSCLPQRRAHPHWQLMAACLPHALPVPRGWPVPPPSHLARPRPPPPSLPTHLAGPGSLATHLAGQRLPPTLPAYPPGWPAPPPAAPPAQPCPPPIAPPSSPGWPGPAGR